MSSFKERYLKLEYIPSRRVKRYDCVSVAMMWSLALFTFLLIVPTEGKPAVGIINGDVFMNWTINDTRLSEPRYIISPNNAHMVYFRIGATTYTSYRGNFSQRITDVGDVSQGVVSFRLSKLTDEDAGRYAFQLQGSIDIGGQVLIIAVPPKQPVVTEFMPAVEGTDYRLSCSASSNSKPSNHGLPMISEWKVRGQSIVTGGRYTIIGTELTIARLTFQDNGATVSCSVYEDQRAQSDESTVWTIDIKYGPTDVLLSSSNLSTVSETSSVSINCTADCNPPCNFLWRRGSSVNSVSTTQTLYIEAASKYDADNYTCFVSNYITMMTRTISTMIIVNYGPASDQMTLIPPEKLITVVEDTIMSINCSTDCYPICKYEWTGPLNLLIQSSTLSLLIDRNRRGTYTCTAKNEQNQRKTATANVTVTVYYGPESSISIGSIPPLYNVNLTEKVDDIICNASCNPPCNFSWYKDTTLLSNNKTLSLGIIKKSDRGNYTCHASNIFFTMQRSYSKSFYMIINCALPHVKLIPSEVAYFSNEGSLTLICTVDQDVRISSVIFRRDDRSYVGIFNPTMPQCNATKYVVDDTSVYSTFCDQERNFTLIKHGTSADNHRKKWICVMSSLPGGPCVGASNPCLSQNVTSVIQESAGRTSLDIGASAVIGVGGAVGVGVGGAVLGFIAAIIAFTIRRRVHGPRNSCFRSEGKTNEEMHPYSNTEMNPATVKPIYEELNKGNAERNVYDKISPFVEEMG